MRTAFWAIGVVGLALAAAGAAAADERIYPDPAAVAPSAWQGALAVSSGNTEDARHLLVELVGGQAFASPARPARHSFDADLGPSLICSPTAVYARCAGTPQDCDLNLLDLTLAVEIQPRGASSESCLESAPSVWREAIVFARYRRLGPAGKGCRPGLYLWRPGRRPRRLHSAPPSTTDFAGGLIAAGYGRRTPKGTVTRVVLHNLRSGRRRQMARGLLRPDGTGEIVSDPVLDRGTLYWLANFGPATQAVAGRRVAPGGRNMVTEATRMNGFAVDRGTIYYTHRGLWRLGPPGAAGEDE